MDFTLPSHTRRLFGHYAEVEKLATTSPNFVVARLFEDGDHTDLRWLTSTLREEQLVSWLQQYGDRQLSRRSHAFWCAVLQLPAARLEKTEELWPL